MEQQSHLSDLTIDPVGAQQIRGIAGWAKFLSIIMFIVCGLLAIVAIFAGSFIASMSNRYNSGGFESGMGAVVTVIYLIIAAVYFIPTLFLFQSATRLRNAVDSTDQALLNEGLTKLKACFRFWGILTIIIISFYLLAFIFGGMAAMMS